MITRTNITHEILTALIDSYTTVDPAVTPDEAVAMSGKFLAEAKGNISYAPGWIDKDPRIGNDKEGYTHWAYAGDGFWVAIKEEDEAIQDWYEDRGDVAPFMQVFLPIDWVPTNAELLFS